MLSRLLVKEVIATSRRDNALKLFETFNILTYIEGMVAYKCPPVNEIITRPFKL